MDLNLSVSPRNPAQRVYVSLSLADTALKIHMYVKFSALGSFGGSLGAIFVLVSIGWMLIVVRI